MRRCWHYDQAANQAGEPVKNVRRAFLMVGVLIAPFIFMASPASATDISGEYSVGNNQNIPFNCYFEGTLIYQGIRPFHHNVSVANRCNSQATGDAVGQVEIDPNGNVVGGSNCTNSGTNYSDCFAATATPPGYDWIWNIIEQTGQGQVTNTCNNSGQPYTACYDGTY